jgi:hypothetical protein
LERLGAGRGSLTLADLLADLLADPPPTRRQPAANPPPTRCALAAPKPTLPDATAARRLGSIASDPT